MPADSIVKGLTSRTPLVDALKLLIRSEINKLGTISGNRHGIKDPDVIHDIRVSARRLQTILESIGEILPSKLLNHGRSKVKEIIKALGKARENDVSINMLRKHIKKVKKNSDRVALALLIARLQKETMEHREEAFSNSKVTDDINYLNSEYLNEVTNLENKLFRDIRFLDINKSIAANGLLILPRMYDRVVRLGKIAFGINKGETEDSSEELHKMRIKAKPLRYTMEFFRFAYGADFAKLVKEVKDFVELLGEIHDKDVILVQLAGFLEEIEIFNRNAQKGTLNLKPVHKFIRKLRKEREDQFKEIKSTFEHWINDDFRQKMILSLTH